MTTRNRRSVLLLSCVLLASLVPVQATVASEAAPVQTQIRDVRRATASSSGATGLLGFTAAQDVVAPVDPGGHLGGARIDRSQHADAFEGVWGQEGEFGGWLAPPTDDPNRHYRPTATLVENVYFENELTTDALPAVPGDHAEFGMGVMPMDTPVPWDRERVAERGTLGWDGTVLNQTAQSTFSGLSGEIDVVMFRADIIARGGDVDARSQTVELEPLVLDLPRVYEGVPNYIGVTSLSNPYLNYITNFSVVPVPAAGKLVVQASISGYIPEAKTYELPNGAVMKEWHLPLAGVIAIDRGESDLAPVATASLPGGGLGLISDALGSRQVSVPPGGAVVAQPGDSQEQEDDDVVEEAEDEDAPEPASDLDVGFDLAPAAEELDTAARVDHELNEPIQIDLRSADFRVRLSPSYRGEGVLALEDVVTTRANKTYADAITVPVVSVDSQFVPLDRSRLIDLRVVPFRNGGGFGAIPTARFADFNQSVYRFIRVYRPGLLIHAVYDLGDGLHAFVEHQMFHGGVPAGGRVNTNVEIKSLDARLVNAYPLQYVDLAEPGPASLSGVDYTHEFTGSTPVFGALNVGDHRTSADYRTPNRIYGGRVTVLRAPAPLTGRSPDPAVSISGEQVALVQSPPPNLPSAPSTLTVFRAGLAGPPPRTAPAPPPLGEPCGEVAIRDSQLRDAPPHADVRAAWFDADGTNVYASLRVADLPAQAVGPTGDRYAVSWRADHQGYIARATVSPTGTWTYEFGQLIFGGFHRMGTVAGETQSGPNGVIRMAIPRDWIDQEDGALFRDPAAHSYVGTTTTRADHAPDGSSSQFGLGGDHVLRTCPDSIPPVLATVLDFTAETTSSVAYGEQATFAIRLVDENDEPLGAAEVALVLKSTEGSREWLATTDDSGIARIMTEIIERAGTYELIARFAGVDGSYDPSENATTLEVRHAPTSVDVTIEGNGSHRVVTARLTRSGNGDPIAGRLVEFLVDSAVVGSGVTNEAGVATLQVPPRYRGANHEFAARFSGDDYYTESSAEAQ